MTMNHDQRIELMQKVRKNLEKRGVIKPREEEIEAAKRADQTMKCKFNDHFHPEEELCRCICHKK
jgi:hypothetical protein